MTDEPKRPEVRPEAANEQQPKLDADEIKDLTPTDDTADDVRCGTPRKTM